MRSLNTYYKNKEELSHFVDRENIPNSPSLLIQIFSAINSKSFISTLLSEIEQILPNAVIVGSTTDGEIMNGMVSSGKVVLSFSHFDHTTLRAAYVETDISDFHSGSYLAKRLITDDTKLMIAFMDGLDANGEEFLNGISSVNSEVVVAGGIAGDNFDFIQTYVFTKDHIVERGAVAVALDSEQLHIHKDFSFHWHPIGNELKVTKAEGNHIYTIDGRSAVDTYQHYLGEDFVDRLPSAGMEFPLMVNRNGMDIARAMLSKGDDGSLLLAGSIKTGEKVRIGFGDATEILNASQNIVESVIGHPSEAIFIYSCTARKHFLGSEIEAESLSLKDIAPISGFFTYGEFYTLESKELLNQTMTLVSLSENSLPVDGALEDKTTTSDINTTSMSALAHLVNLTTEELKEHAQQLKNSNQLNQKLQERIELALEGGKTSVLDWDIPTDSLYVSPAWKEMLGYEEDELQNNIRTWYKLVHPDDRRSALSLIKTSQIKQKKYLERNHRLRHKDGHWIWVLGRAQIIYDQDGKRVRIIGTYTDITKEKELQLKYSDLSRALDKQKNLLHYQANHDALTGLANRTLFSDRLKQGIERAKRNKQELALFFIDLDRFKQINDSLGHEVGDSVLEIAAKRLRDLVRQEDTLARLGGDEFTLIMEGLKNVEDASMLADKILKVLERPMNVDGNVIYISGSIGISIYPQDASDAGYLLRNSDTAMYKAKEAGSNTFEFYSRKMTDFVSRRMVLKNCLRQAVKEDEFELYYQPIVDTSTSTLVGLEALVRWNHPSQGVLLPSVFIPLAEETGLIVEIDRWVTNKAIEQMSKWRQEGLSPGVLSHNISGKKLQDSNLLQEIEHSLAKHNFLPEWLELEMTEAHLAGSSVEAIDRLKQIDDLGVGITIDNVGTGYFSLALLKQLPINKLKIDKTFIKNIPNETEDIAIIKAISMLCNSLDLGIVAEGVESIEQRDFLSQNGCTTMQGYYYGHPLPASQIKSMLLKNSW